VTDFTALIFSIINVNVNLTVRYRPTACCGSEVYILNYESIWTFGKTPWKGDQSDTRPVPTQDNTTQRNADTHPCPEQDLNL
jgi:hypothetical protein